MGRNVASYVDVVFSFAFFFFFNGHLLGDVCCIIELVFMCFICIRFFLQLADFLESEAVLLRIEFSSFTVP